MLLITNIRCSFRPDVLSESVARCHAPAVLILDHFGTWELTSAQDDDLCALIIERALQR
jgi:DNA replication protein DnaC